MDSVGNSPVGNIPKTENGSIAENLILHNFQSYTSEEISKGILLNSNEIFFIPWYIFLNIKFKIQAPAIWIQYKYAKRKRNKLYLFI